MTIHISALVLLANGFEEIEAITVIDILRRANISVTTAGLSEGIIEGSRKTRHVADLSLAEVVNNEFDIIILPGGQPGTNHLRANSTVKTLILNHLRKQKWIAAICAAPLVLHDLGILDQKTITSHPSISKDLVGTHYSQDRVCIDGNIVTSRSAGTAMEFAFKLIELLSGPQTVAEVNQSVLAKL
jgi:protein deglycase